MSTPRSAGTSPAPPSVGDSDSVMVDNSLVGLRIPDFARELTQPLSLNEKIQIKRMPRPVAFKLPDFSARPTDSPKPMKRKRFSDEQQFGLLTNISEKFTLKSLQSFAKDRFQVVLPRLKVITINENSRGKMNIDKDTIVSLSSIGVVRYLPSDKNTRPDYLLAYGTKSIFHWEVGEWELYTQIYSHFAKKYWSPSLAKQSLTVTESKFGGGLGGRKSATTSVGKFCLRGKHDQLSKLSEDDLKRKGVISTDRVDDYLVLRFGRIEQRDFACDSFIVVGSFLHSSVTIGMSRIRVSEDEEALVLIENWETSTLPEKFNPSISLSSFFQ